MCLNYLVEGLCQKFTVSPRVRNRLVFCLHFTENKITLQYSNLQQPSKTSCWFFTNPVEKCKIKICSSNWMYFPIVSGWKKMFELPPPRKTAAVGSLSAPFLNPFCCHELCPVLWQSNGKALWKCPSNTSIPIFGGFIRNPIMTWNRFLKWFLWNSETT